MYYVYFDGMLGKYVYSTDSSYECACLKAFSDEATAKKFCDGLNNLEEY